MKINEWPRHGIQALWAFLTNSHVSGFVTGKIYTGKLKNACVPGLNCYSCPGAVGACPIGSIQAVVGSWNFNTTLVTMYLIGGPTRKTCAATLGTLAGVVLAGISAWCFSKASGITGFNVSDIETLMTLWNTNRIQVGGLLFSGLLISCLGAVMDVAMSISSAIDEIYRQNTSLTRKELFKAGLRVGRDMMGTDSNTLILAFAGSSVSTLLLDYSYDLPYQQIINSNNIGIAIMQGLAGSFGIVLSVPFTVLICTVLFHKSK